MGGRAVRRTRGGGALNLLGAWRCHERASGGNRPAYSAGPKTSRRPARTTKPPAPALWLSVIRTPLCAMARRRRKPMRLIHDNLPSRRSHER
jgi:hypothetical protein